MASTASAMVAAASADVGYREGANNDTKFGRWYGLNFNPWCDMAVSKWAADSGNADVIGSFAYCPSHVNWFKARSQWHDRGAAARKGDIVFFSWDGGPVADHVGVVTADAAAGAPVSTIEGNTSAGASGSQGNGDGAYRRTRERSVILGFGRPAYKVPAPAKPSVSVAHINAARKADMPGPTGHTTYAAEVKRVELALVAEGLLSKRYVDGSWGTKTDAAFTAYRRKLGLTGTDATGAVGSWSLSKLGAKHGFTVKP